MKASQISVAALTLMLSGAGFGASGAAISVTPHLTTYTATRAAFGSDRSAGSGTRPVLHGTDVLATRAATARTRVLFVRPVNASRKLAAGYHVRQTFVTIRGLPPGGCSAGSDVAAAAYRCFTTNNFVIDPCWAEGSPVRSVLCLESPWSTNVTRLKLSGRLDPLPRPQGAVEPWGLHLSTGWTCIALQGTHDQVNGRVVFYDCDGWRSGRVVLLGINHHRPLWRAQTATRSTQGVYRIGPSVAIVTAWYAKP